MLSGSFHPNAPLTHLHSRLQIRPCQTFSCLGTEDGDEGVSETRAANAANAVPVHELREALTWLVTWLVEELWRHNGAEAEAAQRGHHDAGDAREQADGRRLRSVAEWAQRDERADDEVAVRHADLN